jgi:hypothetical protein
MKRFFCIVLALFLLLGCSQTDSPSCCCGFGIHAESVESPEAKVPVVTNGKDEQKSPETVAPAATTEEESPVITNGENEEKPSEKWLMLFDGDEGMPGWMVPEYGGDGEVVVRNGNIVIGQGLMMTGIRYEKEFPTMNYEIQYEARRTRGYDFFAACTFPVSKSYCTFVNGGWGGGVIGLSSVHGSDASENATTSYLQFKENLWYRFRIRVSDDKIQVWIIPQDKEGNWEVEKSVVELELAEKKLTTRYEMNRYKPLGFCTWSTEGQLRNITYRKF